MLPTREPGRERLVKMADLRCFCRAQSQRELQLQLIGRNACCDDAFSACPDDVGGRPERRRPRAALKSPSSAETSRGRCAGGCGWDAKMEQPALDESERRAWISQSTTLRATKQSALCMAVSSWQASRLKFVGVKQVWPSTFHRLLQQHGAVQEAVDALLIVNTWCR
jgi:hypothetical protein